MGRFKKYLWAACVMTLLCWGIGSLIHNLYLAAQEDKQRMANEARLQKLNIPRDQNGTRYRIGNIGGQRVQIPPGIVNTWITYDGDPNDFDFDAKKKYKRPPASYESSIAQFGFKFRISDGALLQWGTQTEVDYQNDSKTLPIPWVYVISKSGEQYPTRERRMVMDVYFKNYINPTSQTPLSYSGQEYGLEVYRFFGGTAPPPQNSWDKEEVYVRRDTAGEITTIIICANNPNFAEKSNESIFRCELSTRIFIRMAKN
jgi:heme exporter protein D